MFENDIEPSISKTGDYTISRGTLFGDKWVLGLVNMLYLKLCPSGACPETDVDDVKKSDDKKEMLNVRYVSPVLMRCYDLMHLDDQDYKFWMIGYKNDYKANTLTVYLFLRPFNTQSSAAKLSKMTDWVNTNIIDQMSPSDIQQMCTGNAKTTIELRLCVGKDFVPENDTKGKSFDTKRIIQAGSRTEIVFKVSWHDSGFDRFGHFKMNKRGYGNQGMEAIFASRVFQEDLEKGLYGRYGQNHVKEETSWGEIVSMR